MDVKEIMTWSPEYRYRILDRMRCDCLYFLGYGTRHSKYLWAGNVKDHIEYMKALWNSFPDDGKPEWLTFERIEEFEKQMKEEPEKCGD